MLAVRASLVRLTEETTDQFKVDLRVKNESIGIEKKASPRGVVNQETYLTQVSRAEYTLGNVYAKLLPSPLRQPSVANDLKVNVT